MFKLQAFLIVLLGIQVALTLTLLVKVATFETSRETVANPVPPPPTTADVAAVPDESRPIADNTRLSEIQLRRIIREEISRVMPFDNGVDTKQTLSEPRLDPAEKQYQRSLVIQELDYLKEQDVVTTAELDKLLGDIAHLDPESRIELLGMLNRAMNRTAVVRPPPRMSGWRLPQRERIRSDQLPTMGSLTASHDRAMNMDSPASVPDRPCTCV